MASSWVETVVALLESEAAKASGGLRLAVSGGRTPVPLFKRLRRARIDWSRVDVFWCDERDVPLSSPRSNAGEALRLLFDYVPARVHPLHEPRAYEALLRRQPEPLFHVALLGRGKDGHMASLFPGRPEVKERRRWVLRATSPEGEPRLTLTIPALIRARRLILLADGSVTEFP